MTDTRREMVIAALIGLLIVAVLIVLMIIDSRRAEAEINALACVGYRDHVYEAGRGFLDGAEIVALYGVGGENIWVGYDNGGFNVPDDTRIMRRIWLYDGDGSLYHATNRALIWIAVSPQTPMLEYWFVFDNTRPYADANGKHYGLHPCAAVRVEVGGS